ESCPSVKNILLLDSEGCRVAVKYYSDDWPTNSAKEAFEKSVFTKTQKTNARTEVSYCLLRSPLLCKPGVIDDMSSSYQLFFTGFFVAVGSLLRGNVDKKEALENLDLILLCLDEIVDGGIIPGNGCKVIAGKGLQATV
ncbi:coatomer subunit zeta-1-like protein, partial [Tanacetum coccineum]